MQRLESRLLRQNSSRTNDVRLYQMLSTINFVTYTSLMECRFQLSLRGYTTTLEEAY